MDVYNETPRMNHGFRLLIKDKRIVLMKRITFAITICIALFLVACGKASDPESSNSTSSNDQNTEQSTATLSEQQASPADQSAESSAGNTTQGEQAAFEESDTATPPAQDTQNN
jgi:hypothetical protein